MKQYFKIYALIFLLTSVCGFGYSQTVDSLGLPGDNLNLYGVLSLFKDSKTMDEFEQKLNTPSNKVNNLDLNNDGEIDYIRVIDYGKGGLHSITLQDPISDKESQDLAVIETEEKGNGVVHIQIVGDEDLYGKDYIIEPQDQPSTQTAQNNNSDYDQSPPVSVNVWAWPSVQFMYGPSYVYWNSPWYWGYYPGWWSPWRPYGYHAYWNGMYGYRAYHRRVYVNHIVGAHNIYYGHRQASPIVHTNITNRVYYGPRVEGKIAKPENRNDQKTFGNQNKNVGNNQSAAPNNKQMKEQRQQNVSKPQQAISSPQQQSRRMGKNQQQQNPVQQQPKQQSLPKQQQAPPVQQQPKQQSVPMQQPKQQQAMPRQQQAAPRQQQAPHNIGGGGMRGGGGGMRGGGGGRRR